MKLELLNETLELLPEKALLWQKKKTLIFSDVHLGKAESFQSMGVPIPSKVNLEDLHRVASLIERFAIENVFILGDLIHNKDSWSEELFLTIQDFLQYFRNVHFKLLIGNHEKNSMPYLNELPMELIEGDKTIGPFTFTHGHLDIKKSQDATQDKPVFKIEGHVHPVILLKNGPVHLRLPCFVLKHDKMILPSFGSFTGGHEILPGPGIRLFAVTKKIIEI